VRNVEKFGYAPVVAINRFSSDSEAELGWLLGWCASQGIDAAVADVWGQGGGGPGGDDLAAAVLAALSGPRRSATCTRWNFPVEEKIRTIVREVYGADNVDFSVRRCGGSPRSKRTGGAGFPSAWRRRSIPSPTTRRSSGRRGIHVHVRDLSPRGPGAGFIIAFTGAITTMPGLPRTPAALGMDVDAEGNAVGAF
jgi:formate--tetrahydrofolate ligase